MKRKRAKAPIERIQGLLFSEQEMQALVIQRPPMDPEPLTDEVSGGLSNYEVLRHAVADNLASDGVTDPAILDNFMGWLGMVSCRGG